jgi:hypothetical protein
MVTTLQKAKGFKKSKPGIYLSIGTTVVGSMGVLKQARTARSDQDTLKLIDAIVSGVAIVTGVALLVRELRRMDSSDVLAD